MYCSVCLKEAIAYKISPPLPILPILPILPALPSLIQFNNLLPGSRSKNHAPIPEYRFKPNRQNILFSPRNSKNQPIVDKNPRPRSTGTPTKIAAGKLIK